MLGLNARPWQWGLLFATFLAMRTASSASAGAIYLILALFTFLGERASLHALCLSWLTTLWNPGLGPTATLGEAGRFLIIGCACLSCFLRWEGLRGRLVVSRPVMWTVALGAVLVCHSILFSDIVAVSVLKASSWAALATVAMCAWHRLSVEARLATEREIYHFLVVVLLISAPLVVLPQGYLRNGSGFQGVLNHPQVFGPSMALLASWTLSAVLSDARPSWKNLAILGVSMWFILASEARTAGLAVVLGAGIALLHAIFRSGVQVTARLPGLRSKKVYAVIFVGTLLGVLQAPLVEQQLSAYISKRRDPTSVFEAYEASRGDLIDSMLAGFSKKPLTGNGFGLPTSARPMTVEYNSLTGLPTAAAVEKGVLPLALLEDLGLPVSLLVLLWLWGVVRRSARGGVAPLALTYTVLAINLGEATLFSPGGLGLLLAICLCWGGSTTFKKQVSP